MGSVISFVKFPNGKVRAKSKMSFESEQAVMAQKLYDNSDMLQNLIDYHMRKGYVCIFELVGYQNQIVLNYDIDNELILLQIRNANTGTYENALSHQDRIDKWQLKTAGDFDMVTYYGDDTLNRLLEAKATNQEDIEGWVITFEDGQMAKIKTNKYIEMHGLIGPDAFRENLLIQTILNGNIDDVLAMLVPGPKKDMIMDIEKKVNTKFNHLTVEFLELRRKYFQDFKEVRKDFAIKHSKDNMFSSVMKTLNTSFRDANQTAEKAVKEYITKVTNSLGKAKEFVGEL